MGAAQLQFYSSLVDLLGRCAPEAEAIKAGRSDSLRARAILRSLVSLEDLEGALGLRFILPVKKMEQVRAWIAVIIIDPPLLGLKSINQSINQSISLYQWRNCGWQFLSGARPERGASLQGLIFETLS